jgi:aspartate racemase
MTRPAPKPAKVLGILGGLGPWAHVDLERKLLAAARELAGAVRDQDYPEWIVASVPQTPDRTAAIDGGPSPLPWLLRGLRRLEGADFVVVACNSAHHFLDELRRDSGMEILDMIDECAAAVAGRVEAGSPVGVLATTGTLKSGLYHRALEERGLRPVSPLDAGGGEELQQAVMTAIYGDETTPGIKAEGPTPEAREALTGAAEALVEDLGCRALIAACTEVPLALTAPEVCGVPLVDSVAVVARAAVARIYGLK